MYEPTKFGQLLREHRSNQKLSQAELAVSIGKSAQYISNIEKGKNNAPPNESDIETLIKKLDLSELDAQEFREKAAADRSRLPKAEMDYIFANPTLSNLINYGMTNHFNDERWAGILASISGGKNYGTE